MAIYNNWSDPINVSQLNKDMKEIYSGVSGVVVSDVTSDYFTVSFGGDDSIQIGDYGSAIGVTVNGEFIKMSHAVISSGVAYRYYAKSNGEMIIANIDAKYGAEVNFAIGKSSDGDWGSVCLGNPSGSYGNGFDKLIAIGSGVINSTPRDVTNRSSTNVSYIALRRCVKHSDVVFENIFINTEGCLNSLMRFELDGSKFVTALNDTGNNDVLVLKLN